MNLLDLFENQLHGQPGRQVMPTEFDLPIPELSEELWPKDVDANPNQNIQNVENAEAQGFSPPPMDDQEIAGVESFEGFQPVQESSPIRPAAQNERQQSGLEPIPEVEVNPQDDHSNGLCYVHFYITIIHSKFGNMFSIISLTMFSFYLTVLQPNVV